VDFAVRPTFGTGEASRAPKDATGDKDSTRHQLTRIQAYASEQPAFALACDAPGRP
jgi:hypothetical protein